MCRSSGRAVHLYRDRAFPAGSEQLLDVETGDAGGDLADERVADPAGVLRPLTRVEPVDDVPEMVILAGGDRRAQRLVGVVADEREAVEDDPQLAGLDVLVERTGRVSCDQCAQ